MKIYIDDEFKCHTQAADDRTAVETDFFDGMCSAYIEGYRYIPTGKVWKAIDGTVYPGEMITPWKPWAELDAAQRAYEREQVQSLKAQNAELLDAMAAMVEDVYQSDTEEIGG
nr:MAG TPA: hypothetical protein [Caudoviricetes sp.]